MAETLTIRGHYDRGIAVCRICRATCYGDGNDHCYISVVRTDTYRPRYYAYCIDCAVREGVAPNATRCPN